MIGWHFLKSDWTAGSGAEPAWEVGERREIEGEITLCERGYHYCDTPLNALRYAPGPVLCEVEVEDGPVDETGKGVSHWRRLIRGKDMSRELRLFACECAERALMREREAGREPAMASWEAVRVARLYADGKATMAELAAAGDAVGAALDAAWAAARDAAWAAARDAAWAAAGAAAWAAAWAAARDAAWAAAWAAARDAAGAAERAWQSERLTEIVTEALGR